jgi:hypothetical protein
LGDDRAVPQPSTRRLLRRHLGRDARAAPAGPSSGRGDRLVSATRRGFPRGVATLLLGSAVFVFAMRAMGGNGSARVALIQLVVAQASVDAAAYWLMRDVFQAHLRLLEAQQAAENHQGVPARTHPPAKERTTSSNLRAANPPFAFRTLGSTLIVVALTRRRSREFFKAAGEAVEER